MCLTLLQIAFLFEQWWPHYGDSFPYFPVFISLLKILVLVLCVCVCVFACVCATLFLCTIIIITPSTRFTSYTVANWIASIGLYMYTFNVGSLLEYCRTHCVQSKKAIFNIHKHTHTHNEERKRNEKEIWDAEYKGFWWPAKKDIGNDWK